MMIPAEKIKTINELRAILVEVQTIFDNTTYDEIKQQAVVNEWSKDNELNPAHGNWNFALCNKHWTIPDAPNMFAEVVKKIGLLPDCFQAFINFMKPNSVLPEHMDDESINGNYGTLRCAGIKCYQISCGIHIPSIDPILCGLELNKEIITIGQGEIVAFDGTLPHRGWNNTDQWRVTLIYDMYKTGFIN
jgi:hypothetical protein